MKYSMVTATPLVANKVGLVKRLIHIISMVAKYTCCRNNNIAYKQNLNAGLLQQHHFWAGLMAVFGVAVLLFIKPKLE